MSHASTNARPALIKRVKMLVLESVSLKHREGKDFATARWLVRRETPEDGSPLFEGTKDERLPAQTAV